jgi:hypothetical protein
VSDTVTIPARFNGPLQTGNGGYAAGALAAFIEGPVDVSLRSPVPLDRPLDVVTDEAGAVRALDGETLVLEARSAPGFELDVPAAVDVGAARVASAGYRGLDDGEFCRCFVCGRAREDGFEVFAGPVEGRGLVASPWNPPEWAAGEDGLVRPEFVWAVLDCPTYFGLHMTGELPIAFLARFTVRIDAPVRAGEEHVVIGWPIEIDGRKHHAGSAVLAADGEVLARARALMIEPRTV